MLWVRTTFQLRGSLSAVFRYLRAFTFTNVLAFKLADIKLESSEVYLLKLGKNLSWDFEAIFIFRKNEGLNICRYLKSFYTYKKINNIFLKFHYYLLRMQKILEIGRIFHAEKRESKT